MDPSDYAVPADGGCLLLVDASPGASKTELDGVNRWRGAVHIRIAAEPKGGAANEELLSFLSEKLGVPVRTLSIKRGARSSRKAVFVPMSASKVKKLLGCE